MGWPRIGDKPSAEALYRLYWVEKMSQPEIAERLGVSAPTVKRWMRADKIPIRTLCQAAQLRVTKHVPKLARLDRETRVRSGKISWERSRSKHIEWLQANKDITAKGPRVQSARSRKPRPCAWCGQMLLKTASRRRRTEKSFCSPSHRMSGTNWNMWHPDEPRPVILERLRNGESGIGESQIEMDELTLERMLAARGT